MESGGITPVIGDLERTTTSVFKRGDRGSAGTAPEALCGLRFPLRRDDMERDAAERGAPVELLDLIARLPNRVYRSAGDVAGELHRVPVWCPGRVR
jgi:hypothetical protein